LKKANSTTCPSPISSRTPINPASIWAPYALEEKEKTGLFGGIEQLNQDLKDRMKEIILQLDPR